MGLFNWRHKKNKQLVIAPTCYDRIPEKRRHYYESVEDEPTHKVADATGLLFTVLQNDNTVSAQVIEQGESHDYGGGDGGGAGASGDYGGGGDSGGGYDSGGVGDFSSSSSD